MNYTPSFCSVCGGPLQHTLSGTNCPQCSVSRSPEAYPVSPSAAVTTDTAPWGFWTGLMIWLVSVILLIMLPLVATLIYAVAFNPRLFSELAKGVLTKEAVLISLVATFGAQVLTLALAWLVVTKAGRRPFFSTLGWNWHPQFRMIHAVGLTILMFGVALASGKFLPHKETSLDKVLEMGLAVRVTVAILATLGAPIVEEVVYRGILFPAIERVQSPPVAVIVVTLLFWGVHVSQYWGSMAVLVSVFVLSLALTLVRAVTRNLLPCVATHFLFNGVQAVQIILAPGAAKHAPEPARAALAALLRHCGIL